MRHPSLWLILNYPPQIKKKKRKLENRQPVYIYRRRAICIANIIVTAAANYIAPVVSLFFLLFLSVSPPHLPLPLSLSFSLPLSVSFIVDPVSRNTIVRTRIRSYIASPDVINSSVLCVSLSSEMLMGRLFGKDTLPFTRDNHKEKEKKKQPATAHVAGTVTGYCCCRERHVDGFDVRWIYTTITTVLAAVIRFSRLSLSTYLCHFFLACLFVLFPPLPVSTLLSLLFPSRSFFTFSFPLTSSKVLHVHVCVRSFFLSFSCFFFARSEALVN